MLILDTDVISILEWSDVGEASRLSKRLARNEPEQVAVTIISFEEQMRGWTARLNQERTPAKQVQAYQRLRQQLENYCGMNILDFDTQAADEFLKLKKSRIRVGTMDLKIAAIVLAHDATLLSRNLSDFGRIPHLKVEDWSA